MKIWGIILIVIGLIKTFIFEKQDNMTSKLLYQLDHNFTNFQETLVFLLAIDILVSFICGLIILFVL